MNKQVFSFIIAGMLTVSFASFGQEKQGDTDYTNNRSKGKPNQEKQVNTKQATPVKIIQYIPGTWVVEQVLKGKEDITGTDTLARNQTYEFNREGRYVSYADNEKIDSGAYRVNEEHGRIYLASATGEIPTEWNVWFDDDGMMTLQQKNANNHAETFRYVYRRTGTTTTSNR